MTEGPLFYDQKVEEAIQYLRDNEPERGYSVAFSGGKDSIVMYDLVKRAGVKIEHIHYTDTGLEPPELKRYVKEYYPEVEWARPVETFWQIIRKKKVLPTRRIRWCCEKIKKKPAKKFDTGFKVTGIRASESPRRRVRGKTVVTGKRVVRKMFHPIFDFTDDDVWKYIRDNKMPYCSLYDEGFTRLGCIVCPFVDGKKLVKHRERWPGMYRVLDKYLKELWDNDRYHDHFTFEEFMQYPDWPRKGKSIKDQKERA